MSDQVELSTQAGEGQGVKKDWQTLFADSELSGESLRSAAEAIGDALKRLISKPGQTPE